MSDTTAAERARQRRHPVVDALLEGDAIERTEANRLLLIRACTLGWGNLDREARHRGNRILSTWHTELRT